MRDGGNEVGRALATLLCQSRQVPIKSKKTALIWFFCGAMFANV